MVSLVVEDRVAVVALNHLSAVLLLVKVELVLNEHIAAHIFGQVRNIINLYNKVDSLVNQVCRIFWYEVKIPGITTRPIRIDRNKVQTNVSVHFEG